MEWNAVPVHTSPDGETEKGDGERRERGRDGGKLKAGQTARKLARRHTSTHAPAMENSCIGLRYPEAEEGILTFPSLQATSDPWLLPPDWRLAAAAQDGERTGGGGMTITEECEFVLRNVTRLGN